MFCKRNCFAYMCIQYYELLNSSSCEGTLDAPGSQQLRRLSLLSLGDCVIFMFSFYLFICNLQSVFTEFFESSGSHGKKPAKREAGTNPRIMSRLMSNCHPISLDIGTISLDIGIS